MTLVWLQQIFFFITLGSIFYKVVCLNSELQVPCHFLLLWYLIELFFFLICTFTLIFFIKQCTTNRSVTLFVMLSFFFFHFLFLFFSFFSLFKNVEVEALAYLLSMWCFPFLSIVFCFCIVIYFFLIWRGSTCVFACVWLYTFY